MSTAPKMSVELYGQAQEAISPLAAVPVAERLPVESLPETAPSIFSRVRDFAVTQFELVKHRLKLKKYKKAIDADPENTQFLNLYSNYLESKAMRNEAAAIHGRLVTIFRRLREADKAAVYCRKLDVVGNRDAPRCYRELATLYSELDRFDEAARAVRRVVELYLAEGQQKAAAGYLRQLPSLGVHAASTRDELENLTNRYVAPKADAARPTLQLVSAPVAPVEQSRPAQTNATSPLATPEPIPLEDVFLSGHLGRITPFDVVQIVESNSLTGRLDFLTVPEQGALFFRDGHIVAAISGAKRGHDALRAVFTADPSPFRVVVSETIPPDEFKVINNTGLLLDIIREIDEAAENESQEFAHPGVNDFWS